MPRGRNLLGGHMTFASLIAVLAHLWPSRRGDWCCDSGIAVLQEHICISMHTNGYQSASVCRQQWCDVALAVRHLSISGSKVGPGRAFERNGAPPPPPPTHPQPCQLLGFRTNICLKHAECAPRGTGQPPAKLWRTIATSAAPERLKGSYSRLLDNGPAHLAGLGQEY